MCAGAYKHLLPQPAPRSPPALAPNESPAQTNKITMNDAELYHKHNSLQKRDALEALQEYAKKTPWRSSGRVMDVGCGDGDVTTSVLRKLLPMDVRKLVGCDVNTEMVHFANKLYGDKSTQFLVLDIGADIPRALHNGFDHVFSSYVFHWIKQQETAFTNIYNLLDEGGDCLLVFLGHMHIYNVYRVLAKSKKWAEWLKDVDRYISPYHDSQEPEKEVTRLMAQTGFKNIEVQCKKAIFSYNSIESLKKAVKAVNPFDIPKDLMEDYLEDFIEIVRSMNLIDQLNNNEKEPITITFEYALIIAQGKK